MRWQKREKKSTDLPKRDIIIFKSRHMKTLNSGSFWLVYPPPPISYFPSRKQDFYPEVFLSVGLPLEIMATFLYLTRILFFFAVPTRCGHWFTLECHNPMLFLLPDTPHRIIPIPMPPYSVIFFTKGYQAYMHFLHLFLSFNKQFFQPLNFTFSCTLIAFIKGIFFNLRVKIIVLPLANHKSHQLFFLFHALPRIIVNAMNSAWHPVELHFVLLLML